MLILISKTRQRIIRNALFFMFCGYGLGCGPQGEIVQNIQPPHQAYLDRQNPVKLTEDSASQKLGEPGLPESCVTSKPTKAKLCLTCRSGDWLVARCYSYNLELDTEQACYHTTDSLKCLVEKPAFALSLAWRVSQEKFLRENFLIWKRTLHSIWDEKLNSQERSELDPVLNFLDKSSQWLSKAPSDAPHEDELRRTVNFLPGNAETNAKNAKDMLDGLQTLRLSGKLKLANLLDETSAFLEKSQSNPRALAILRSLNTQGLDE